MAKNKTENYFDKFIEDQLQRSQENLDRRKAHQVPCEIDQKRHLLRLYRERVSHLIKRGKKNG